MKKFALIPESAVLSLGGFTLYEPEQWDRYLRAEMFTRYPFYALRQAFRKNPNSEKMENDCIEASIRKYLLHEFGVILPGHTLFRIYNAAGEGVKPKSLIESVDAVIEPLGLEIDQILVPNPLLRRALGWAFKMADLGEFASFDGRPGICMINIENGYNHAFFWQKMNPSKFASEQFRMALTIRRKDNCRPSFSALQGLEAYSIIVKDFLKRYGEAHALGLVPQLEELIEYANSFEIRDCDEFRIGFSCRMDSFLVHLAEAAKMKAAKKAARSLVIYGEQIKRVFLEIPAIG